MTEEIRHIDPEAEFFTSEGCFFNELSNTQRDPDVSVARARVRPGTSTRWHRLLNTTERYVILSGSGRIEIGESTVDEVRPGDVAIIPPGCRQRITCLGTSDLVFLAICSPRFEQHTYEDIDPAPLTVSVAKQSVEKLDVSESSENPPASVPATLKRQRKTTVQFSRDALTRRA